MADFIGETNFLAGTVTSGAVTIGSGDVLAVPLSGQTGAVSLAIRPEQINIGPAGSGLAATVVSATYLGTDTHYTLALSDDSRLIARVQSNSGAPLNTGETVGVGFDLQAVQVLAS